MVDHRRVGVTGRQIDLALALLGVLGQRGGGAAVASRRVIAWIGGCVPGQVPRAGGTRAP
jgi:hypothetical protein